MAILKNDKKRLKSFSLSFLIIFTITIFVFLLPLPFSSRLENQKKHKNKFSSLGRPVFYGLAKHGEGGATYAIDMLNKLEQAMVRKWLKSPGRTSKTKATKSEPSCIRELKLHQLSANLNNKSLGGGVLHLQHRQLRDLDPTTQKQERQLLQRRAYNSHNALKTELSIRNSKKGPGSLTVSAESTTQN
jgi:hypothetical protein